MKLSLRSWITANFFIAIVIYASVVGLVGVYLIDRYIVDQAQDKVRLDLNSADVMYQDAITSMKDVIRYISVRSFIQNALIHGNIQTYSSAINDIRKSESLDILNITDTENRILLRSGNPGIKGDRVNREILKHVSQNLKAAASTEIISAEELLKENKNLYQRAYTKFVYTEKSLPYDKDVVNSGMMLIAASPVLDKQGKLIGLIYGGRLLNHEYSIVDKIKETLYRSQFDDNADIGKASIFQGPIRISTNVIDTDGKRATGTQVSEEVQVRVLIEGKPWIKRAFVVKDWMFTAYKPILNISGDIIGILGVGMFEWKYTLMRKKALLFLIGIILVGMVLSMFISNHLTKSIIRPINVLVRVAQKLGSGDLTQRVPSQDSAREIDFLGETINTMAASIQDRDVHLKQSVQEKILKSEKLAMIGRLAAGVAHEINNPLGSIRLFSGLLLKKPQFTGVERENLERIEKETVRCQNIVQGLLDFARLREPRIESINVNELLETAIGLFEKHPLFHNIEIIKEYETSMPVISVDPEQIEQVFINIIMNSADAMRGKGTLTLITKNNKMTGCLEISFADTGCGIPDEMIDRIFEPFFTTKKVGYGTGLGLSISHGIVEKHNGTIKVLSEEGRGSIFTVVLPVPKG